MQPTWSSGMLKYGAQRNDTELARNWISNLMFYLDIRKDGEEEILFFVTIFLKKK